MRTKTKRTVIEITMRLREDLAREYVNFMGLAYMMGNLDTEVSPRDKVDLAFAGLLKDLLTGKPPRKG